jgi:DNA-binding XRE family transcriptional regulator
MTTSRGEDYIDQCALSQLAYGRYALVQSVGSRNAPLVAVPIYEDPDRASKAFGRRVRELRAREGLSQDGLAHTSGIHLTSIGRIERGGREPRLTTIQKLAKGLGVEPGELTNGLDAAS